MNDLIYKITNDEVAFLIFMIIIVLIMLIIVCISLLKSKFEYMSRIKTVRIDEDIDKTKDFVFENKVNETPNSDFIEKEVEVSENIIKEIDNKKMDLESMLSKMEESLNEKEKAIVNFEQEQEEKAIISYEELKKAVSQNNNTNVTKVATLEKKEEEIKQPVIKEQEEVKNFKNTDFISPIYGKQDNNYEYPKISNEVEVKEKEEVVPKHSKNNNEAFLDSLKEFRKNLE